MALLFNISEVTSLSRLALGSQLFLGEERRLAGKRGDSVSGGVLSPKRAVVGVFISLLLLFGVSFMVEVIIIKEVYLEY